MLSQTITIAGLAQPLVQTYEYDSLNRLSQARETYNNGTQSWKQVYGYDRFGNRSFAAGTTIPSVLTAQSNPAVNAANNRLSDNQGYGYDAAGNMTGGGGVSYVFDAENRIMTASDGQPQPSTYSYDGDGRRVKKVTANGQETTIFVYNAMGQLVAEYNNLLPVSENQTSYVTSDALGTPRVVTKANGEVKSRHDYLPFGEEVGASVGGRTQQQGYSQADGVRQKFAGSERDSETGLDFMQARYLSNTQGRFNSPDPLLSSGKPAEPRSWNRYTYVLDNPLKYVDPSGLKWGYRDYTENGQSYRAFRWFDGDVETDASGQEWQEYNSAYAINGDGSGYWLDPNSSRYQQFSHRYFTEGQWSDLVSTQLSGRAFSKEQTDTIDRGRVRQIGDGWLYTLEKIVAGGLGAMAGGRGAASGFTFGAAERQATRLPPILFHYTDEVTAGLIGESQLGRPGGQLFLTNNGSLTPLQAQIELSLPARNSARALFAVDTQTLGGSLFRSGRVTGNVFNRAGGGFEFVFDATVPKGSFTRFNF